MRSSIHPTQGLLHDIGPFLLALSAPATALLTGLPRRLRINGMPLARLLQPLQRVVFDPWTATTLFVGVGGLVLWVLPSVHFVVMISWWLYAIMNWTVILVDLPFWCLVLDPRPHPPARLGPGVRILMLMLVMLPMVLTGAIIGLTRHEIYPVYGICGRAFPLSAVTDQQIGGLIIWIPASLIAVLAALIVISRLPRETKRTAVEASAPPQP
jgi:putative membrane protein